jgi:hypothetical protein
MASIAADRTELALRAERGEALSEVEQCRLRLNEAEARAEAGEAAPPAVVAPAAQAKLGEPPPAEGASAALQVVAGAPSATEPKVIDPPDSAFIGPSEVNVPKPHFADNPRPKPPPPVIEHEPAPPPPTEAGQWDRSENGQRWKQWRDSGGLASGHPSPFSGGTFEPSW